MARTRINQASMKGTQWGAFIEAVKKLKARTEHPNYDDFALAHTHPQQNGQAHMP